MFLLALALAAYCWHLTRVLERDFGAPPNPCHDRDGLNDP
jgi:hypothetical protein